MQTQIRASFLALIALVALAAGCGSGSASKTATTTSATPTPTTTSSSDDSALTISDTFTVGADGHHLALSCVGKGSPTVILEAGTDTSGIEVFSRLLGPVTEKTKTMTCTYDRVGTGGSDPPSKRRRTLDDVVTDLHGLLDTAGLAGPFVLAGSSGGGNIAMYYAGRYPEQMAGVVLLDVGGPNPHLDKEFPGAMGWKNPEHIDWVDAERRLSLHPKPLGDIPLQVVTATSGQGTVKNQSVWLKLSTHGSQTTLEGGHDIYEYDPNGVVEQIRSILDARAMG